MSEGNEKIPDAVLQSLKGSGFPFQTAVAHVIGSSKEWSIDTTEYPWRGPENADRFLDIVAVTKRFVLTIECKKTRKDTFTFLRPLGGDSTTGHVEEFRCLNVLEYYTTRPAMNVRCETWTLSPNSPSCEFCIIGSGGSGSQRLLERDASLLVAATDVFAQDVQEYSRRVRDHVNLTRQLTLSFPYLVLPVIVTNAKLYTARYNPSEVSLESGEFEKWPTEMESDVPWIRFSKTFIAGRGRDIGYRSVFVVNSMCLKEFLETLEESPKQPIDKMAVPLV